VTSLGFHGALLEKYYQYTHCLCRANAHSQVFSKYTCPRPGRPKTVEYVPGSQLRQGEHEPRATRRAGVCCWEPDYLKATLELDRITTPASRHLQLRPSTRRPAQSCSVLRAKQVAFELIATITTPSRLGSLQEISSVKLFLTRTLTYGLAHSSRDHGMQTPTALRWLSLAQSLLTVSSKQGQNQSGMGGGQDGRDEKGQKVCHHASTSFLQCLLPRLTVAITSSLLVHQAGQSC
jgi:hypothetical protein